MPFRLFPVRRTGRAKQPRPPASQSLWQAPPWLDEARKLEDGSPLSDGLMAALHAEIAARAMAAGAGSNWPPIRLSELRVRRAGMPDWWAPNGNLTLAASDAEIAVNPPLWEQEHARDGILAAGAGVRIRQVTLSGAGGLLAVGDRSNFWASNIDLIGRSTVLVGEQTIAVLQSHLDARNGGAILIGADGLWANGVRLNTDDSHAIRDLATGERLNAFGGRIVIERHVWLCLDAYVMGDSWIGADSVVGQASLVRNCILPPNSVSAGRPAKPVRRGVTWSREDTP